MENGYNNGSSNNDYQFTRPENNASNYGGGYNNSGLDMTPMTMGEWIVTLIIMAIPCVNIIMCFVWGFGSTGNLNRRNFCRAYLIMIGKQQRILLLRYRCIRETEISIRK